MQYRHGRKELPAIYQLGETPGGETQGCIRRGGTAEVAPEAVAWKQLSKRLGGAVTVGYRCH